MFKKSPTTVAEAVAPFKEVQKHLRLVINKSIARRNEARRLVDKAEAALVTVKKGAQVEQDTAASELAQAEKIMAALSAVLGES